MAEGHVGHSHHVVGNGLVRLAGCCGDWLRRRVLRGGSFNNNRDNVRCAYRNNNNPDNRNNNIGFRVVGPHGFHRCPVSTGPRRYSAPVTACAARTKAGAADSRPRSGNELGEHACILAPDRAYTEGRCTLPDRGQPPGPVHLQFLHPTV